MRLTEAVRKYIEQELHVMDSTRRAYEDELRLFLGWALAHIGDSAYLFTGQLITDYLVLLSKRRLSQHLIARRRSVLAGFSRWGASKRYWSDDVLQFVPKVRRPKTVPRPFTKAERDALMALPLHRHEHLLRALLFYSGLRITEAMTLRVHHFASEARTITVIGGKGDKSRTVSIPPVLVEILKAWVLEHTDLHPQTFLFQRSRALGTPMTRHWAGAVHRRWGRRAGVAKVTPHRFRHTYGTMLLERRMDLKRIQQQMGHESIETTAGYLGVVEQELTDAIARVFSTDEIWVERFGNDVTKDDLRAPSTEV